MATIKVFAIAGEDKKFVWADARIVGNTMVVSGKYAVWLVHEASCKCL